MTGSALRSTRVPHANRKLTNYDMHSAFGGARFFGSNFNPKKLRSLPGSWAANGSHRRHAETGNLLRDIFRVDSFAYEGLGTGVRAKVFRELVTKSTPSIVHQSALQELLLR